MPVIGRKPISELQSAPDLRQLDHTASQLDSGVDRAFPRFAVNVSRSISREPRTFLPERGIKPSGFTVEGTFKLEVCRVVRKNPALIAVVATIGTKCRVYVSVREQETRAVNLVGAIEG